MREFTQDQRQTLTDWVFNLRSGAYQPLGPCKQFYEHGNDRCGCAVGVLGRMLNIANVTLQVFTAVQIGLSGNVLERVGMTIPSIRQILQESAKIVDKTGLTREEIRVISDMYEGFAPFAVHSFCEVADFIEKEYLKGEKGKQEFRTLPDIKKLFTNVSVARGRMTDANISMWISEYTNV